MATPRKRPEDLLKVGRPSRYDPKFCAIVEECGKNGGSIVQMALACDVDRATLSRWEEEHPEFRASFARAKALAQDWWEKAGQTGMLTHGFNAAVWKHMVASRFREDYADRKVSEVTGKDGGAIKIEAKVIDASQLDDESLDIIEQALLAATGDEGEE
jgi:hypothetical protein